jgi:hypothetical protein
MLVPVSFRVSFEMMEVQNLLALRPLVEALEDSFQEVKSFED